jgi:hypothetical protein
VKVNTCRFESYICRVVRDPQLGIIGLNRRCSSVMETRSTALHRSYWMKLWTWNHEMNIKR